MNELPRPPAASSSSPIPRRPLGAPAGARSDRIPSTSMAQSSSDSKKDLSHVPCKFQRSGGCTAGSACVFSHAQPETGHQKQPCQYFQKGTCKFGKKCALAHILPGQPMSFDRKNKKAAGEALTQAASQTTLSPLPPIPRTMSNGTSSNSHAIPAKPASPAHPSGLPPNPNSASNTTNELSRPSIRSSGEGSTAVGSSSSRSPPVSVRGFTLSSLFPTSSATKATSSVPGSGLPSRPSAVAVPSAGPSLSSAQSPSDGTLSRGSPLASNPSAASASPTIAGSHGETLRSSFPTSRPPPGMSLAFGSAVRPPNGTSFPLVARKDIVFGTTDRESPTGSSTRSRGPSDESPLSSVLNPSSSSGLVNLSPQRSAAYPTPIAPPPPLRRPSHGLGTPPTVLSYSPQHSHLAPSLVSPPRRLIPPLSSSTSYQTTGSGLLNGAGANASPFSTSPFSGPRGLFLSSSYDNHVLDRSDSFASTGQVAGAASMVDRPDGRWGGRQDGGEDFDGSGDVFDDDDDGEDLLPSSLNELLTEQEMERRMTRRGSHNASQQPTLGPDRPTPLSSMHLAPGGHTPSSGLSRPLGSQAADDHRARMMMEFSPLARGHNSVPSSSSTVRRSAPAPMRSPWDDDDGEGTGRTVGRGRNTIRRPPVPFESSLTPATNGNAQRDPRIDGEGDGSFKLGPSHASVAFLPNFGERRQPSAPTATLTDSFGHLTTGYPLTSSSSNATASLLSSSLHRPSPTTTSHLYAQATTSSSSSSSAGFPTAFTNLTARPPPSAPAWPPRPHAPPLTPAELAASHEPGMSLPPGLGIGLGRTRGPAPMSTPTSTAAPPIWVRPKQENKAEEAQEEDEMDDDVLFD